jgi:hypothetical protein
MGDFMQKTTVISTGFGFLMGIAVTATYFVFIEKKPTPPPAQTDSSSTAKLNSDLLPPPQFLASQPAVLRTSDEAEIQISWTSVPGAGKYNLYLVDKKDKVVKTYSTSSTSIFLKDIPGGRRRAG